MAGNELRAATARVATAAVLLVALVRFGAAPAGAGVRTVDSTGMVGRYTSIAIGTDGRPILSYVHDSGQLRVAHCDDRECASASIHVLDAGDGIGSYTSIAIGADGRAAISYRDGSSGDLKIAHCDDVECTDAAVFFVDPDLDADVGSYSSIAIGTDGFPLIVHLDTTDNEVRLADCTTASCVLPIQRVIDGSGQVGAGCSIAVGADGTIFISYQELFFTDLVLARCDDDDCDRTRFNRGRVEGSNSAIAIGAQGRPLVAHRDATLDALTVMRCFDDDCATQLWTAIDDAAEGIGTSIDIAVGADGLPMISYWDSHNGLLKLARCIDADCTSARVAAIARAANKGGHTSIAIDGLGQPVISFFDDIVDDLRVVYPGIHSDGFEAGDLAGWEVGP